MPLSKVPRLEGLSKIAENIRALEEVEGASPTRPATANEPGFTTPTRRPTSAAPLTPPTPREILLQSPRPLSLAVASDALQAAAAGDLNGNEMKCVVDGLEGEAVKTDKGARSEWIDPNHVPLLVPVPLRPNTQDGASHPNETMKVCGIHGHYFEIDTKILAQGSDGKVYTAWKWPNSKVDEIDGKVVVAKIFKSPTSALNEIEWAKELSRCTAVPIFYDVVNTTTKQNIPHVAEKPLHIIFSELMNQGDLGNFLTKFKAWKPSFPDALTLTERIAEAKNITNKKRLFSFHMCRKILHSLAMLHEFGVYHGDVKPQNFLVSDFDFENLDVLSQAQILKIKIADFGYSTKNAEQSVVDTKVVSIPFTAPEIGLFVQSHQGAQTIINGDRSFQVDVSSAEGQEILTMLNDRTSIQMEKADAYSAGLTLIEILYGEKTRQQYAAMQTLSGAGTAKPAQDFPWLRRPPAEELRNLPGDNLIQILQKLTAIDPAVRITARQALQLPFFKGRA